MDLKNITMDDLKQKLASIDKKTLIKFGAGFGAIILFLIVYYIILNPMVKERKAKHDEIIPVSYTHLTLPTICSV